MTKWNKPSNVRDLIDTQIEYNGQTWIISQIGGFRNEDGARYVVLRHPTEGWQKRNGFCYKTTCDWIDLGA